MKSVLFFTFFLWSSIILAQIEPLINNDWQMDQWPYNAYYPLSDSGPNGHVGNDCGATAMARILHYWQFPENGVGSIDYIDQENIHWVCDLDTLNLDYSEMYFKLSVSAPKNIYHETAKLFFACGSIGAKNRIGRFEGIYRLKDAMHTNLNYDTIAEIANRWEYTRAEWIEIFKNELDNGRPIIIAGRSADSPAPWETGNWEGHFFICDGYNSDNEFYINYSAAGIKGYFDIDSMHYFSAYHRALINLIPLNFTAISANIITKPIVVKLIQNPSSISTKLVINNSKSQTCLIQLFDINGCLIENLYEGILETGDHTFIIDCSLLKKGIYILNTYFYNKTVTKKLIVI